MIAQFPCDWLRNERMLSLPPREHRHTQVLADTDGCVVSRIQIRDVNLSRHYPWVVIDNSIKKWPCCNHHIQIYKWGLKCTLYTVFMNWFISSVSFLSVPAVPVSYGPIEFGNWFTGIIKYAIDISNSHLLSDCLHVQTHQMLCLLHEWPFS